MTQLSKNIWRSEVACKCGCGFDTIDIETVEIVQDCCDYFAKKLGQDRVYLNIHSGARCKNHNKAVGGTPNSQHLLGRALDISIAEVKPEDVYRFLDGNHPTSYGLGNYSSFTHIDTRTGMARW